MAKETKIESKVTKNPCIDSQLYTFITDFRNIGLMMPPEMKDKATFTKDTITFQAGAGMQITMHIVEQIPNSLVKLGAEGAKELTIWIQLKQVAPYDTRIRVTLHINLPMIAKMLSKKKLQTFVDGFADALAQIPTIAFQANTFN